MKVELSFNNNIFEVIVDDQTRINQPFMPSSSGHHIPWEDKEQALAWWETIKDSILPPIESIVGE